VSRRSPVSNARGKQGGAYDPLPSERVFRGLAGFLAVTTIVVGVSAWLGADLPVRYPGPLAGITALSAGTCILVGVWAFSRSPLVGGLFILPVAVPLAVLLAWAVVPPVVVLLMLLSWARTRWVATHLG
jgi:hypothetical protein